MIFGVPRKKTQPVIAVEILPTCLFLLSKLRAAKFH